VTHACPTWAPCRPWSATQGSSWSTRRRSAPGPRGSAAEAAGYDEVTRLWVLPIFVGPMEGARVTDPVQHPATGEVKRPHRPRESPEVKPRHTRWGGLNQREPPHHEHQHRTTHACGCGPPVGVTACGGGDSATSSDIRFDSRTQDAFARFASYRYQVDTSGWTYDDSACDLIAQTMHAAKNDPSSTDWSREQVMRLLGPASYWGQSLRNNFRGDTDLVAAVVDAGTECADDIAAKE
jgi:hypothetical protein